MTPKEQMSALLEYVKTVPKDSWRYEAIRQEIKKIERITGNIYTDTKATPKPRKKYVAPHPKTVYHVWELSKHSKTLRDFSKKIYLNRYSLKKEY